MRRAYLELLLLGILKSYINKLSISKEVEQTMKEFVRDTPNPMGTDEYQLADKIR